MLHFKLPQKKIVMKIPLEPPLRPINSLDLLQAIQQDNSSSVDEFMENYLDKLGLNNPSSGGYLFEKLYDIVIKLGYLSHIPMFYIDNKDINHFSGNNNIPSSLEKIHNIGLYLSQSNVFSKNDGGSSDITMKIGNKWIFISSKYFLNDSKKSIKDYDIQDILAVIEKNPHKYKKPYEIWIVGRNKDDISSVIKSSQQTNYYLKDNNIKILDLIVLNKLFCSLQKDLMNLTEINIININKNYNVQLNLLQLRLHQDFFTDQVLDRIDQNEKEFLWGWKCRSGKTYGAIGLLLKFLRKFNKLNVLFLTPIPSETLQDIYNTFQNYNGFENCNLKLFKNGEDLLIFNTKMENNILFGSKQLFQNYINNDKIVNIFNLKLDMIIFDEKHLGGCSQISKDIIKTYSYQNTIKLYLTATFNKIIISYDIPKENQFIWGLIDEADCVNLNIGNLSGRHGNKIIKYCSTDALNEYKNMPKLHLITGSFDQDYFDKYLINIKNTTPYGFSYENLFSSNKNGKSNHPHEQEMFWRYFTGSEKEQDFPNGDHSVFNRIRQHSVSNNSRTTLSGETFSTILFFLPCSGVGTDINQLSLCVKNSMEQNRVLKKYRILPINSKTGENITNLKKYIEDQEEQADEEGKIGLIILAGKQCSLGITLPKVDVTVILNNSQSSDTYFQMGFRSMTESFDGSKKFGYVFVHSLSNTVNILLDYQIDGMNLTPIEKITYLIEHDIIGVDIDRFNNSENKSHIIQRLIDVWKKDPKNQIDRLKRELSKVELLIDKNDQKKINRTFADVNKTKKSKKDVSLDKDIDDQSIQKGIKIKKEKKTTDDEDEDLEDELDAEDENLEENILSNISFIKEVVPSTIFLACSLTLSLDETDIMKIFKYILNNPDHLEAFNFQTNIWWKNECLKLIIELFRKYIPKNSEVYSIVFHMKYNLKNLLDNKLELLEYINDNLTPKESEKQELGEVFTPVKLIDQMLDQLDINYQQENHHSIFSNPNLSWFDPAVGMGNFPIVIYYRLMDGLKEHFILKKQRQKHILEKMLFMSEINSKNVLIMRQIFQSDKYHLNLFRGDTLKDLDIHSIWNVDKFDIVIGNPPYNIGGIKSHTGKKLSKTDKNDTIWPAFVKFAINCLKNNGYLIYITPLSWLKKSHSCHNILLEKQIVWLKLWDNSNTKYYMNAEIPISFYILKNENVHKLTIIESVMRRRKISLVEHAYLNKNLSLPISFFNIYDKLYQYIIDNNCKLEYKRTCTSKLNLISSKSYKLPESYLIDDNLSIDTHTIVDGIKVKKSSIKHIDQSKSKLVIANKSALRGLFIDDGRLGLCGTDKYYIIGDNLSQLKDFLDFKIFKLVSNMIKYRQDFLQNDTFDYIPDIRKITNNKINESQFYKILNLTDDQIKLIKNF